MTLIELLPFLPIILGGGGGAIESVNQSQALRAATYKVYDTAGRLVGTSLDDLPPGIYIIKSSDGTVKKVGNGN